MIPDYKPRHLPLSLLLSECGGTIYLGISPAGLVTGLTLNRYKADELRMGLDGCLSRLEEKPPPELYNVSFIPVYSLITNEDGQSEKIENKDLFVIGKILYNVFYCYIVFLSLHCILL